MNYFTIKRTFFVVPSTKLNEEFEKLDIFLYILEKSNVSKILEKANIDNKKNNVGRKGYNIYNLFATIVYCFTMHKGTLREIEDLCKYDLRIIYLMEQETPTYALISEFINKYIKPYKYEIFTIITKTLIDELKIDISVQYVDGTKLEANANKYKFVWKPTTFHKKLDTKIKEFLKTINMEFNNKNLIKSYQFYKKLNEYAIKENININNIPSGRGSRPNRVEKNYKIGYQYLIKLLEYEEKEEICGYDRNSYYKTDHDATAMALKTDYYSGHGTNMHAAYNTQVLVSNLIITMFGVYQNRSDYHTFTPMLTNYHKYYNCYPKNIAGDSGYGIYENYKLLKQNNIGNYLKYQQWQGEASGKKPQLFYTFDDGILCLNANLGEETNFGTTHQRYKDGKLYIFKGCNDCLYSYKCKEKLKNKEENFRKIELIPEYELLKEQARNNLLSPKGIEIRINRSIQVEGAFGQIKQNMGYTRVRRRGIEEVETEFMLVCLGKNMRRLFSILSGSKIKNSYWNIPKNLTKEIFPFVKQKKDN